MDGVPAWLLIDKADIEQQFGRSMPAAKRRAVPAPRPYWAQVQFEALRWLDDNGSPMPGSGEQADFERHIAQHLSAKGYEPAESTVRRHCKD